MAVLPSNFSSSLGSQLPKPPLALKKNFISQEPFTATAATTSTEALLKMADEGLANIELELKQGPKKNFFKNAAGSSTLDKIRMLNQKNASQPKQEI